MFESIDKEDINKLRATASPRDINRYFEGTTALFYAVNKGSPLKIIKILCGVDKMDINRGSESGETPLSAAVRWNHTDIIKYLCRDDRVNVIQEDWATEQRQNEMSEFEKFYPLIARLAREESKMFDASKINNRGDSLLHMAVFANQPETIRYLCEKGKVDFKAKNINGQTAFDLIFSSEKHLKNNEYQSILQIACKTEGEDICSQKDSRGQTVLHLAVMANDEKALKMLCDGHITDKDINAIDNEGNNCLSLAIQNKKDDIALFLLSLPGIDVDIFEQFEKGIFHVLKEIIFNKTKMGEDVELGFILDRYLTEAAVAIPKGQKDNIPFTLEKLFETADSKTSILSELRSKIDDRTCARTDVKSVCTALLNVIISQLQQCANHKRLQYLFYKGSVFRTCVQIFVDLDYKNAGESENLMQLLRILYISTQANIKCNCIDNHNAVKDSDDSDLAISKDPDSADVTNIIDETNGAAHATVNLYASDNNDGIDKSSVQHVANSSENFYGSRHKLNKDLNLSTTEACKRSLKQTLGKDLFERFKSRIEEISDIEPENNGKINDIQLIAQGIHKAYFKEKYERCEKIKKRVAKAIDCLSSLFCLNKIFHKCICRGNFAFIMCFVSIFVHASDVYSDARFGFKTLYGFSERLGLLMITLVLVTLIQENIRSLISAYETDQELLRITLGKIDLSNDDFTENSDLNYYNDWDWAFKWIGRYFWTFKVYRNEKSLSKESLRSLFFNALSLLMLRPIVDRLIVLTHSPSHLRVIYRQQSKQKSLNQYYMILEQMPELFVQFYVFQIYFNNLRNTEDYSNHGCTEFHSFTYRTGYFECVENVWSLNICAPWWEIYSMLIPFVKIPNSMVSLEEMFRKLSPETPKMSTVASCSLYLAYIFMIPTRLFLFAAVMHSATDHLYVVAYLGSITFFPAQCLFAPKAQKGITKG